MRGDQRGTFKKLAGIERDLEEDFKCNLTWESINHFTMLILNDGSPVSIYRN